MGRWVASSQGLRLCHRWQLRHLEILPPLAPHHHQTEVEEDWWTQFSTQWLASSLVPPCPAARVAMVSRLTSLVRRRKKRWKKSLKEQHRRDASRLSFSLLLFLFLICLLLLLLEKKSFQEVEKMNIFHLKK